ncbi:hypothetical protein FOXYS1_15334 [Fusarium oxysporum]|uniref:Peptidase A1 domain-containing protein n=1 Tax=Fusarium oxysporum TaxID=5507 RepID=A0A8H4ZB54_FUSOX|nr:hypothetical protein FOXYS1_15334 [Fusarium oxysporum]
MWTRSFVVLLGVITTVHCRPAHDTTGLATSTPLANNTSTATLRNYVVVETASANCVKCALKPTPCDLDKEPKLKELPAAGAAGVDEFVNTNDSGGKNDGDYDHHGPIATLLPAVHWDCDTQPATNVVPIPPEKGSQMYYGVNDPTQPGHFAFLTYYFKKPSVNLDHCDHVSNAKYGPDGLTITFSTSEAYNHAQDTWDKKSGMVLIAYIEGCGDWEQGERCYFQVTSLEFQKGGLIIVASGNPSQPEDIISFGETEWGWWQPREGRVKHPGSGSSTLVNDAPSDTNQPSKPGDEPSFTWDPVATASNTETFGTSSPSSTSSRNSVDFSDQRKSCKAPVDTRYGLPSACLGEFFDLDLDSDLGSEALSQQYKSFTREIAPDIDIDDDDGSLRRRGIFGSVFKALKTVTKPFTTAYKAFSKATAISGSFNKEISWKLPDPSSKDPRANKLRDPDLKQVQSPWGDSILLKAFGKQPDQSSKANGKNKGETMKDGKDSNVNGYMNIYCVGCGVSGSARIAGKASWSPIGGFQTGQLSFNTDIRFVLQIGIDAQLTYKREFKHRLLDVGLPGLSYGIVRIGPAITVDSRVELEADANGKLLVGAEMGLQNAEAIVDFVEPRSSSQRGFDPYFKPIFEAEGELMLSATLGLPLGLRCGVKVAGFSVDVALIDEPSINGVAKVAAKAGLNGDNELDAGFTETNGCTGISTQMSWRNRLYVDLLSLKEFTIHDTKDNVLAQGCIKLPGLPSKTTGATTNTAETNMARTNAAETNSVNPPKTTDRSHGPKATDNVETGTEASKQDPVPPTSGIAVKSSIPTQTNIPDQEQVGGQLEPDQGSSDVFGKEDSFRRMKVRQLSSDNEMAEEPADNTLDFEGGSDELSYDLKDFKNSPYNLSTGYELALMVDSDVTTMVVSCANGNMYAFLIEGEDNPYCSEMWSTKNDVLITDGAQRFLHYYNNTMSVLGVSRLRVEEEKTIPNGGVIVALVPYYPDDNSDDYYYLAVDPNDQVFYPIVCDYSDGRGSKMFLASDPDGGAELLKSKDLMYTVTGGEVSDCYALALLQGEYAEDDDYLSYRDSEE